MGGLQEGHGHRGRPRMGQVRRPSPGRPNELQGPSSPKAAVQRRGPPPHRGAGPSPFPGGAAQNQATKKASTQEGFRQDPERHFARRGNSELSRRIVTTPLAPTVLGSSTNLGRLDQHRRGLFGHTEAEDGLPRAESRVGPSLWRKTPRRASISELGHPPRNNLFNPARGASALSHELFGNAPSCRSARSNDPFINPRPSMP